MSETLTALVLAGLVGIVLSGLFFFTLLGRRTRAAFQDGLQRQSRSRDADVESTRQHVRSVRRQMDATVSRSSFPRSAWEQAISTLRVVTAGC